VPYQLHCDAPHAEETVLDELELGTELFELDEGVLLGTEELTTELATELLELDDVVATELDVTVEHTAPVIVGFSAATPLVSPCTPKLTDWPG